MKSTAEMLSVSQLNTYLKILMDSDAVLQSVFVRGEISNLKYYASSGHIYFTLKDESEQLRAVMFRTYASRLPFRMEDGMKVIAHGRVSVYGASGQYQLYADDIQPDGAGALALRFEQLKRKLEAEGLFAEERKKPLPPYPGRIGVITSPSGAAIHDIKHVLGRRYPLSEVILYPSAVQGAEAPEQLTAGVEFFGISGLVDVIILGRGGGSAEDLWAFNDETLARAVAACPVPIISAVGHESDFTICDFVADRRAPTPSAAAEIAVPDGGELLQSLAAYRIRMESRFRACVDRKERELGRLAQSRVLTHPEQILDSFRMRLAEGEKALAEGIETLTEKKGNALSLVGGRLEALSPLSVLRRGYSVVYSNENMISRAEQISGGETLTIRFADGCVTATAEEKKGEILDGKKGNDV